MLADRTPRRNRCQAVSINSIPPGWVRERLSPGRATRKTLTPERLTCDHDLARLDDSVEAAFSWEVAAIVSISGCSRKQLRPRWPHGGWAVSNFTVCWFARRLTTWFTASIAVFTFWSTRTAAQEPATTPLCNNIVIPASSANNYPAQLIDAGNKEFNQDLFGSAAKDYIDANRADGDVMALYNLSVALIRLSTETDNQTLQEQGNALCIRAVRAMQPNIASRPRVTLSNAEVERILGLIALTPSPSPSPSVTPSPSPSPSVTPSPSPSPSVTPSPSPSPSVTPSPSPSPSETPTAPWWRWWREGGPLSVTPVLLGGAAALVLALYYLRNKRRRNSVDVRINTPDDLSIQVCGRTVTLTANTIPPGRESQITWEVPLNQFQTEASGRGAVFTTSWTETGLKQVVARVGKVAADDVMLFVYKTASVRATVSEILESAPPRIPRRPSDYRTYRQHQYPIGLE